MEGSTVISVYQGKAPTVQWVEVGSRLSQNRKESWRLSHTLGWHLHRPEGFSPRCFAPSYFFLPLLRFSNSQQPSVFILSSWVTNAQTESSHCAALCFCVYLPSPDLKPAEDGTGFAHCGFCNDLIRSPACSCWLVFIKWVNIFMNYCNNAGNTVARGDPASLAWT